MWNRPRPSFLGVFAPLSFLILSSLGLVGCGEDELSDEAYGFLDLAPYFFDGSTPNAPTAGLPKNLSPQRGWMGNRRAEYYDFGLVNIVRKRSDNKIPDYAVVNPMYFFYKENGEPLFSKPIYEERTGLWHIRGGRNVRNPNPLPNANKKIPYSVRQRDQLGDFQRPIIDRINQNTSEYTGLWEIVEVTVPPGYVPDAIKHAETLQKGVDAGTFRLNPTQVVINCPLVDDRTYVTPSAMAYGNPTPRIEVWYRTKMGSCYLVNGFESLGFLENDEPQLYPAGSVDRLDTFDVTRYTIGEGNGAVTTVVAPVGFVYIPRVRVLGQDPAAGELDIRYANEALSDALPRRSYMDPPGYKPIRWLWDITVPQDPPFEPGTFKALDGIDPARLIKRGGDVPFTRNYPIIGVARDCTTNDQCNGISANPKISYTCNKNPALDLALNDAPPGLKAEDLIRIREGGPRCDVRAVGLGEACAPGISRCEPMVAKADPTVANFPESKGNPKFLDDYIPSTYTEAMWKEGVPPPAVPGVMKEAKVLGGYSCHPFPTGYCHFRCDGDLSAGGTGRYVQKEVNFEVGPQRTPTKELVRFNLDARCGDLPGYSCLNPNQPRNNPTRNRVCLRTCNTNRPETWNQQVCNSPVETEIAPGVGYGDIAKGTTCLNRNNVTGCIWDPAFEPRDSEMSFIPPPRP
jgi:hypothetical protein